MGQNLGLPNFEGEQPGDTYYFSPLTVLLFGIVDNTTDDGYDKMDAYLWREQDGDRGASNICSCLLEHLKMHGWLRKIMQSYPLWRIIVVGRIRTVLLFDF